MLYLIFIIVFIISLPFFIAFWFYFTRKNSNLNINLKQIIQTNQDNIKNISIEFELENKGDFHSIILDCQAYLLPPINHNKKIIYNQKDFYFDTIILKKNKKESFWVNLQLPKHQNIQTLAINVCYYDLKPIRYLYKEFNLNKLDSLILNNSNNQDNQDNQNTQSGQNYHHSQSFEMFKYEILKKTEDIFCLKTPIITHYDTKDYLISLISMALVNFVKDFNVFDFTQFNKKVLICIAESLVAIIQGRAKSVFQILPSEFSQIFNHYFDQDSSLSSPYALDLVIKDIGFLRFYISLYMGIIGKILGIRGLFYVFAGRKAAAVDDAGGTIRPYDKFVVLAPEKPTEFANEIKKNLVNSITQNQNLNFHNLDKLFEIYVVDSNDLGKVDILGGTNQNYNNLVIEKLKTNPQGNDDQQTPIVFILTD